MTENNQKKAYLAGGCFWWMEELFRNRPWVVDTRVGYMGGHVDNPTYQNHGWHAEAIEILYDSELTSYQDILDFFFTMHDPTTVDRQGNDRGDSYRSAIFYQNSDEKIQAEAMIEIVNRSGRWMTPVVTRLEEFQWFHVAEWYHQDYLQENPNGYTCHYVRFPSYL
jgi:peptide-methionine (S)-S-oxide reductase